MQVPIKYGGGYNTNTAGKGIYYSNDTAFTISSPPNGTVAAATTNVAQIQFFGTLTPPPSIPPACTTISAPANNATGVSLTPAITWAAVGGVNAATSYEVKVGTTDGGSDTMLPTDVGNVTTYTLPVNTLSYGVIYYVTITPKNSFGPATSCTSNKFTTTIACPTVTAPATGAIGQSLTPTITWSAVSGITSYTLTVGTTSGGTDIMNNVNVGNVTSYTFATPLSANTKYYYKVNAVNGSITSPSCTTRNFTTQCNLYTIPYFEGFETGYTDGSAVAGCLSQASVTGSSSWTANNTAVDYNRTPRTGAWNAYLQYGNERWLFIPVQLTGGTAYQVKLYARQDGATATDASMMISYGTAATAAAMTNSIVADTPIINGDYQKISGNFVPATTGTYIIGIKGKINSTPWYISLDDISIDLAPTCLEPTALSASAINGSGATLSWTAPATAPANGYDVYYSTTNTAPVATTTPTTTATATTTNLTGLSASTQYFVWVRSNCSATDQSIWVALPSFTTTCATVNVPYTQDFESVTTPALPICTTVQNAGTGNNWGTASSPGFGFTTKVLQYGWNGTNAANTWFYTQGINLSAGTTYKISFNYGNNSTTYTEKLKVAFGTGATNTAMVNPIVDLPTINQATMQYGYYTFTVPTSGVYYFGFNAYSIADQFNLYVDNINIDVDNSTSWVSTNSWTNGVPDSSKTAIIDQDYLDTGFVAKELIVNAGKNLVITTGAIDTNAVTNYGTIKILDGANFKHESYLGSGTFKLEKATNANLDKYVFWSSPVAAQNMYNLYSVASQFVMTYNTATDYYTNVANPTNGVFGKGYSVKVPVDSGLATFTGKPNNGTQTSTISKTVNANGNAYNLIGNPYPTNLDLNAFFAVNNNKVAESFYFWSPNVGNNTQTGSTTVSNPGWAVYNANTTTWSAAGSGSNSIIRPGQGFIVTGLDTSVSFNNAMRTVNNTGVSFFNKNASTIDGKYWLQMALPNNTAYQMAVTHSTGGSNVLCPNDSQMMSVGNDAIYGSKGTSKLAIVGKANFVNTDVVTLGNKNSVAGSYIISVVKTEGIFSTGQAIYLKDKLLNTVTDITNQGYTFTAPVGEFTNRFEIVYQPQGALATVETTKDGLKVYRDGEVFVVENTAKLDKISVFDASGRLVKTITPNAKKAVVEIPVRGVYIFNITSEGKEQSKKIIK